MIKKTTKSSKGMIATLVVNCVIIAVLIVAFSIANSFAFKYELVINSVLAQPIVDKEELSAASASGQKMAQRIVEEGTTLLKNDNDVLPLSASVDTNVNIFGWHSVDWLYGTGGGMVSSGGVLPEDDDIKKNIDLYKALNEYGIRCNDDLYNMYYNYKKPFLLASGWKKGDIADAMVLVEPSITDKSRYTDKLLADAKAFSDTAIVVISRLAGEGGDCPAEQIKSGPNGNTTDKSRHFLEISTEEEALLEYVGANFEKVIVLINTCNQFELGFLDTIEGIDACLYVGYTGTRAAVSLPKILYGDVSPSGHTVDTFAYDIMTNPSAVWTIKKYSGIHEEYLDKVAGIYTGYKWYETADKEDLWSAANGYPKGYESVVQFPFGFGLSYTEFDWSVDGIEIDGASVEEGAELKADSEITFTVTVTNIGERSGRDTVEIYCTPPYEKGGIEKSFVNLVGYAKTNIIEPNAGETITVTVDMYDCASYDCYDLNGNGIKGYELDKGDYLFKLMTDSHTVKEVVYDGSKRSGSFSFDIPETLHIEKDPTTGETVKNLFTGEDAVDTVSIDGKTVDYDPEIPWISRANMPTPAALSELFAGYDRDRHPMFASFDIMNMDRWRAWDEATGVDALGKPIDTSSVTWGKSGNLKLAENGIITELGQKLGADYDAEEWTAVLDQVTFDEALNVMNQYYGSAAIDSVGKPWLADLDGPTQIKGYNTAPRGTGYPSMVITASTWDPRLCYDYGKSFGDDMISVGMKGLWGFANDLHVNPFFGRNNESPSEDPFLAGVTMSNTVKGLNTRGRYCFIKHFATYEASVGNTWMSEQALRETVLKAHRKAFVEGGSLGVMTSYQSVGSERSTNSEALLSGVLRGEWKFRGAVTSDALGGAHQYMEGLIRCGGNFGMNIELGSMGISYSQKSTSNRLQHRMRESVHQILYTWLRADYNEREYIANPSDGDSYTSSTLINSWVWWKPLIYTLDAVMACVLAFWLFCVVSGFAVNMKNSKRSAALACGGNAGDEKSVANTTDGDSPVGEDNGESEQEETAIENEQVATVSEDMQIERTDENAQEPSVAADPPPKKKPVRLSPEERAARLEAHAATLIERAENLTEKAELEKAKAARAREKAERSSNKAANKNGGGSTHE